MPSATRRPGKNATWSARAPRRRRPSPPPEAASAPGRPEVGARRVAASSGYRQNDFGRQTMSGDQPLAEWNAAAWHGKMLVDYHGEKIGKLQDVYVDVETDVPQFATVKEGFIGRHL